MNSNSISQKSDLAIEKISDNEFKVKSVILLGNAFTEEPIKADLNKNYNLIYKVNFEEKIYSNYFDIYKKFSEV